MGELFCLAFANVPRTDKNVREKISQDPMVTQFYNSPAPESVSFFDEKAITPSLLFQRKRTLVVFDTLTKIK